MNLSRRQVLRILGSGSIAGLAGCSSLSSRGTQNNAPVILENNGNTSHQITVSVTTIPDDGVGFTEYFCGTWLVESDSEHAFEEALTFTDHEPDLMVLVVLENESAKRSEFSFGLDLIELRVTISENGEIKIQAKRTN